MWSQHSLKYRIGHCWQLQPILGTLGSWFPDKSATHTCYKRLLGHQISLCPCTCHSCAHKRFPPAPAPLFCAVPQAWGTVCTTVSIGLVLFSQSWCCEGFSCKRWILFTWIAFLLSNIPPSSSSCRHSVCARWGANALLAYRIFSWIVSWSEAAKKPRCAYKVFPQGAPCALDTQRQVKSVC